MAVKIIHKTKTESEQVVHSEVIPEEKEDHLSGLSSEIDQAAEAYYKLKDLNADVKIAAGVYKEFEKIVMDSAMEVAPAPPDEKFVLKSDENVMEVSAEGVARTIESARKVFNLLESLQEGLAFELMLFKLGDLDKYLSEAQLTKVLSKEFNGRRSVKFYPKKG